MKIEILTGPTLDPSFLSKFFSIAQEVGEWSQANFGHQISKVNNVRLGSIAPLMGIGEEIGELNTHNATHDDRIDAIADTGVYLCDFCIREAIPEISLRTVSAPPRPIYAPHLTNNLTYHYGQLLHCVLKHHQGIRGFDDNLKYFVYRDQVIINLLSDLSLIADLVSSHKRTFLEILETTWAEVKQRNWKKNPQNAASS